MVSKGTEFVHEGHLGQHRDHEGNKVDGKSGLVKGEQVGPLLIERAGVKWVRPEQEPAAKASERVSSRHD